MKRPYRKGQPLSVSERKLRSVSRKKDTHKAVTVFIHNAQKERLDALCSEYGMTQAELIELIELIELLIEQVGVSLSKK